MDKKFLNEKKYQRAIDALKKSKPDYTEDDVLAQYLKSGGAIEGDPSTYRGVPDMTETEKNMLGFLQREAGINTEGLSLKEVAKAMKKVFAKRK